MSKDIYQEVTDAISAKLAAGVVPWREPFPGYGRAKLPRNYNSDRPYRGINVFLLAFSGYSSPYWLTFDGAKQAAYEQAERTAGRTPKKLSKDELKALGAKVGGVRKGEKSTLVIFWKIIRVDAKGEQLAYADRDGKVRLPMLRYFRVFNVEQCDGIDPTRGAGQTPEADTAPFDPIAEVEAIVRGYFDRPGAPRFTNGGNVAFYAPPTDEVRVPEPERFVQREDYYATTFHEMTHSTGHADRLARKGIAKVARSSEVYADEELVAEMGAAMLCGVAGIAPAVLENAAAYIDHWRRKISEDPKLVVNAAARAQKAADYILGIQFGESEGETESAAPVLAAA